VSWFTLFVYSGLAATLLPGGSEILLAGMLIDQPESAFWLWLIASLGNTLGAYITLLMGGLLASRLRRQQNEKQKQAQNIPKNKTRYRLSKMFSLSTKRVDQLNNYGAWLLLLSWIPIIGDGFCLAAGYLGWPKRLCLSLIFIGKAGRYGVLWLWLVLFGLA
jgi:membrane protein YqaA with SNARE-associated domain